MKRNMTISFFAGVAISMTALYFAFRNVPLVDLFHYLASINYFWVVPSVLTVLLCFFLRALRWQIILGSAFKIGIWRAFHPLMIGFMINCVLPGRVGEVARPAILKKRENIPFTTGLATVAAERVFDVALLIGLFMATIAAVQIDPDLEITFGNHHLNQATLDAVFSGMLKMAAVLMVGILMISFGRTRKWMNRLIMAIPKMFLFAGPSFKDTIQRKFCKPLVHIVDNIALGFTLIKYPGKVILCIIFSFVIWVLHAVSYYIFALGSPGINLTFTELFAVMIIVCFFIALPSVPGFWGLWEAGGVFALSLFGVSSKDAAGFTLANHAIQVFPVILVGLISAIIASVNFWQLPYKEEILR